MFGYENSPYDREVYETELRDFLPDTFVDIHAHIWKKEMPRAGALNGCSSWQDLVAEDCSIEDLMQTYADLFPGKTVKPLVLPICTRLPRIANAYARDSADALSLPHLYHADYDMPAEELEREVLAAGAVGLKPFFTTKPAYMPNSEIRIFDFLPKAHLEVADKHGWVVILHMARDLRLRDPVNVGQLLEIEEKYPNVKLIVAHVGRAYAPEDMGDAFEKLKDTKNMMFDFSANTCRETIRSCIETVGPRRVFFGSDMPISKMRMYRIVENGVYYNVVPRGLYGDVAGEPHMRETDEPKVTNFLYEELLSFKNAAADLGLSRQDVKDIMYENATRLLPGRF